jgi:hypothetical protein
MFMLYIMTLSAAHVIKVGLRKLLSPESQNHMFMLYIMTLSAAHVIKVGLRKLLSPESQNHMFMNSGLHYQCTANILKLFLLSLT